MQIDANGCGSNSQATAAASKKQSRNQCRPESSGEANHSTLSMKRLINRRDAMHLLISHSNNTGILDGDVSKLSLHELASLLSTLMDEIGAADALKDKIDGACDRMTSAGRKRPRSEMSNNNNHAVLLFVERVMYERFSPRNDGFVEKEMNKYFGFNDAAFIAQEKIMCLAFSISFHAMKQCLRSIGASLEHIDLSGSIPNASIIDTALRLIDFIVATSKCERVAWFPSSSSTAKSTGTRPFTSKRQKYQHLLQNKENRRDKATEEYKVMLANTPSVIEEKYSDQWKWLGCFRQKYSEQRAVKNCNVHQPNGDVQASEKQLSGKGGTENHPVNGGNLSSREKGHEEIVIVDDSECEKSHSHVNEESYETDRVDSSSFAVQGNGHKEERRENELQASEPAHPITPLDELDKKAQELRMSLITMPPSDLSNAVEHITKSIVDLLKQYGELDGASGIGRCGDVMNGAVTISNVESGSISTTKHFHLSDVLVSSVVKDFLTDGTGALRATAFLRSFVLPLLLDMNPRNAAENGSSTQGKPASRLMTSLLTSLARDRPIECVESILVPTLVSGACDSSLEPNRFQCELIARVLKGKDALSIPAISLFTEKILPSNNTTASGGMIWTENSMPLVSACLNRQPPLSDAVVAQLTDKVVHYLSPATHVLMEKSMKFSTVFHVLVSKYGQQVKAMDKVSALTEAASRLKTFMGKTINTVLSKL